MKKVISALMDIIVAYAVFGGLLSLFSRTGVGNTVASMAWLPFIMLSVWMAVSIYKEYKPKTAAN